MARDQIVNRPAYCENTAGRCPEKQTDPATHERHCRGCDWLQAPAPYPLKCRLCDSGDQSYPVVCYNCGNVFHLHASQLKQARPGDTVIAACPYCLRPNAWERNENDIAVSGKTPVPGGPVYDVRGRK